MHTKVHKSHQEVPSVSKKNERGEDALIFISLELERQREREERYQLERVKRDFRINLW
jgi:hypothetical protein